MIFGLPDPDPNCNSGYIYISLYIFINFNIISYFIDHENNLNFRCYRSDPDPLKKVPDPDQAGQKSPDPDPHS